VIREAAIGDVALIFNGKTPSRSEQRTVGHPVLKIKDVDDKEEFIGVFDSYVDEEFSNRFKEKVLEPGDFLILNAAHNADYVGSKTYCATAEVVGAIPTGEWTVIRASKRRVVQAYLNHWLRLPTTVFKFRRLVKGIHLYPKDIADLRLPVPHPDEQRRAATILDKADAIRRNHRKILAETEALLRATYLDLVGFQHPNHPDWPLVTLGDVAARHKNAIRTGPFGSDLLHSEFTNQGIAVLGIDNAVRNRFQWDERRFITEEKFQKLQRYRVFPGDVIVTIMGTTGRSAVVPDDIPEAITTKHLATITPDGKRVHPLYLSFAIHSDPLIIRQIKKANKGAIMAGLNLGIIKALEIRLPPFPLQQKFARVANRIFQQQQRCEDPQLNGDHLFASLSHRAFHGGL
jgi:type I restriction enzyme S subunit